MTGKAIENVRCALREKGCATRPELSAATGLSKVRVNQIVANMLQSGELRERPQMLVTTGRPARQYEFAGPFAEYLLILITEQASTLCVRLDLLDACGGLKNSQERRYAHLQTASFGALLEDYEGRGLKSVVLCLAVDVRFPQLRELVRERCGCDLKIFEWAEGLSFRQEDALSIVLQRGQAPRAYVYQGGCLRRTGDLSLLPMPEDWESLNYEDRTLLAEMISALVLYLSCSLLPRQVFLWGDCWNERLEMRIAYNCKSKLRGSAVPSIEFLDSRGAHALAALRRTAFV